jgi:hypothetical protein
MKRTIIVLLAVFALLGALTVTAAVAAKPQPAVPHAVAAPAPQGAHHPAIETAIRHLDQAREALERAEHDFGGHRTRALNHIRQALDECHKALEFKQ